MRTPSASSVVADRGGARSSPRYGASAAAYLAAASRTAQRGRPRAARPIALQPGEAARRPDRSRRAGGRDGAGARAGERRQRRARPATSTARRTEPELERVVRGRTAIHEPPWSRRRRAEPTRSDRTAATRRPGSRSPPTRARRARARRTRPVSESRSPGTKPVASRAGIPTLRASTTRLLATCSHQPRRRSEQEVVDDVDARRRRAARRGSTHVFARATPRSPGSCRRSSPRRAVIAQRQRAHPVVVVVGLVRRNGRAPSAGTGCVLGGSQTRSAVGERCCGSSRCRPRPCRSRRTTIAVPSGRPTQRLVGLDLDRARRREHDLGELGLDVERLPHRRAGERAVVDTDRQEPSCRVHRSRDERLPTVGSDRVHVRPSHVSNVSPRQNSGRGRVDGEHDPIREPRPLASCRAGRSRAATTGASAKSSTGADRRRARRAPELIGERRHEHDRGDRDDDRDRSRRRARVSPARGASGAPASSGAIVLASARSASTSATIVATAQHTRSVLVVGARERRVAQRAETADAEQHAPRPAGSGSTAARGRRARAATAPASAPTAIGSPMRGRGDRADGAERDRGRDRDNRRHGDPGADGRWSSRVDVVDDVVERGRILVHARADVHRRRTTCSTDQPAAVRRRSTDRARAGAQTRGGRRPRRDTGPRLRACSTSRPPARERRAADARGAARGSLDVVGRAGEVDDEREPRRRRRLVLAHDEIAAPRARRPVHEPRRVAGHVRPDRAHGVAGPCADGRCARQRVDVVGARGRDRDTDRERSGRDRDRRSGSATRTRRVRTKTPSGADVRSSTRTCSNTPRRAATRGTTPSAGDAGAPPLARRVEHAHLDPARARAP